MKLHKMTIYVCDHEGQGMDSIKEIISNHKYLDAVTIEDASTIDIKNWNDNHETNQAMTIMGDWWAENAKDAVVH